MTANSVISPAAEKPREWSHSEVICVTATGCRPEVQLTSTVLCELYGGEYVREVNAVTQMTSQSLQSHRQSSNTRGFNFLITGKWLNFLRSALLPNFPSSRVSSSEGLQRTTFGHLRSDLIMTSGHRGTAATAFPSLHAPMLRVLQVECDTVGCWMKGVLGYALFVAWGTNTTEVTVH